MEDILPRSSGTSCMEGGPYKKCTSRNREGKCSRRGPQMACLEKELKALAASAAMRAKEGLASRMAVER